MCVCVCVWLCACVCKTSKNHTVSQAERVSQAAQRAQQAQSSRQQARDQATAPRKREQQRGDPLRPGAALGLQQVDQSPLQAPHLQHNVFALNLLWGLWYSKGRLGTKQLRQARGNISKEILCAQMLR